jgi:hypothetical protein
MLDLRIGARGIPYDPTSNRSWQAKRSCDWRGADCAQARGSWAETRVTIRSKKDLYSNCLVGLFKIVVTAAGRMVAMYKDLVDRASGHAQQLP